MVPPGGITKPNSKVECNFMRIIDDLDQIDPDPSVPVVSPAPRNWMEGLNDGQDVQRTMQDLALGSSLRPSDYMNSTSESSFSAEAGLSPSTGTSSSNRPTPNSGTSSDTRPSNKPVQNTSGRTSYETSPVAAHLVNAPAGDRRRSGGNSMDNFFSQQQDYGNHSTGLTPDTSYTMAETPPRFTGLSPGAWEMNSQTTGLTPVGDGVFRHLMSLNSMDAMDIGWEENP